MSVRPDPRLPYVQDMPPPGGFRKIDVSRKFPVRGLKGYQIWGAAVAVVAYGFWTVSLTSHQRAEQKLEDRRIRYIISPLLQAEADLEYMQRAKDRLKKEKETMKNVDGWNVQIRDPNSGDIMSRNKTLR
mmetsp:Transcript_14639/g.16751  ORF Transcript_14639/g.16751 Transcript_14639/m.16751 type:complete len:130 (-) Transcript_14639:149-538(-)|eukprot:CAMPEP_0194131328 /NCGR_PEP_ID=MMETSP0152-20130528/2131_1 /TAXON_ID=1049557 /ORGANISM="Thalassiothrix antarctica, Strain L6-D1" /LENGTH=129 /DNA_ID=CAMNT_0038826083 /DNA_START=86 /DNA_END=475 /DNA_ORIENTATION=+